MRSNHTFLFYLTDSAGRSLVWNYKTRQVDRQASPRNLTFSPDGWMDTQLAFGRSTRYYGINRTFTTPYKFVEDGALIIRSLLYTGKCYEENIYLNINKWNGDTSDIYEPYYKGQLDLLKIVDDAPTGITVNLIEGGFLKLLNANDETEYEIPLDGPYTKYIKMDGIALHNTQPYQLIVLEDGWISGPGIGNYGINQYLGLVQLNGDGVPTYVTFNAPIFGEIPGGAFYDYDDWIFKVDDRAPNPVTFKLVGSFTHTLVEQPNIGTGVFQYRWDIANDTANVDTGQIPSTNSYNPNYVVGQTKTIEFDWLVTLNPGEKLFLSSRAFAGTPGDGLLAKWLGSESKFSIDTDVTFATTYIKAISPYDLANELLKKVTGSTAYNLIAPLLLQYRHLLLTSGDGIRGLPGAVIKTTFFEFFSNFNKILFAGFGNDGLNLYFDSRLTFYNPVENTLDLGEVSEFSNALDEPDLVNTVKVGYTNQDYSDLNGRQEFNTTFKYQIPVVNAGKRELDLVSTYRADGYGIEYTRINMEGKITTDNDSDNDTFIINSEIDGTVIARARNINDTVYLAGNTALRFTEDASEPENLFTFTPDGTGAVYAGVGGSVNITSSISSVEPLTFFVYQNGVLILADNTAATGHTLTSGITVIPGDIFTVQAANPLGAGYTTTGLVIVLENGTSYYKIRREDYDVLTGVLTDTVFNIEDLTPKRMLLKHAPYLRSVTYWQTQERVTFLTADKNKELYTDLDGYVVDEDASVRADTLGSPMFYPYIFSFKTRVPLNFTQLLTGAINGHVKFTYNGHVLYGFPVNMTVKPSLNDAQDWQLLASPMCNLQDLVSLNEDIINIPDMGMYALSFSHLSPVQWVPMGLSQQPAYHFTHMDAGFFRNQIDRYSQPKCYYQKWEATDLINIQCITKLLGPVQVNMYRSDGLFIASFGLQQTLTPAVALPYIMFQGSINLASVDLEDDYYQLICVAGIEGGTSLVYKSEWMHIQAQWPNTMLVEYSSTKNFQNMVFSTTYRPQIRLDLMIDDYSPKTKLAQYEDQTADSFMLDGIAYRQFSLWVGDERGSAPWNIDKLNRIFLLPNVKLDGKNFTREIGEDFEVVDRYPGVATSFWRLLIREAQNLDSVTIGTDGRLNSEVILANVDTMLFGDLSLQVSSNPVQVEVYEPGFSEG